jgi:hypothetical protein
VNDINFWLSQVSRLPLVSNPDTRLVIHSNAYIGLDLLCFIMFCTDADLEVLEIHIALIRERYVTAKVPNVLAVQSHYQFLLLFSNDSNTFRS